MSKKMKKTAAIAECEACHCLLFYDEDCHTHNQRTVCDTCRVVADDDEADYEPGGRFFAGDVEAPSDRPTFQQLNSWNERLRLAGHLAEAREIGMSSHVYHTWTHAELERRFGHLAAGRPGQDAFGITTKTER